MTPLSPLMMLSTLAALLIFVGLSMRYDQASFNKGPHLALACLCAAVTVSYLSLAVIQWLTPHAGMAFTGLGLLLLGGALAEIAVNRDAF